MNRTAPAALLLTALLLSTAGCVARVDEDCSAGDSDFKGDTLRLLDHGAFDYMHAAIAGLWENETGAKLQLVSGQDAGSALKTAIQSRGATPPADVIYGIDNALFFEAARAGILEPYASPNLARLSPEIPLAEFRDARGRLVATPADHGYINVNMDARLQNETAPLPTTLAQLASAEWAPRFVVEDPRLSSPGLGFLIATVATFGENDDYDYLDYWRDLMRNGALVAPDWTTAYVVHFSAGYGQGGEGFEGDRSLVVSYTTSPAYEAYFSGAAPPSLSLEPPKGSFHQIETAAILACTQNLLLAQRFIDFVLSDSFQDQVSANMAMYPVVAGAEMIPTFETYATAPGELEPAPFTSAQLDAGIPRWLQAWQALYQNEHG